MPNPLTVVFMGTSDFAVPTLLALDSPGFRTALVVTQPDRPAGRHLEPKPSAVKAAAAQKGWEVFQPPKIREEGALDKLRAMEPDLLVVAAYGQILPKAVLDLPRLACLNVHASILPRWRGAAPIHYAVMAGDVETGVTIMHMNEKMDEGDILLVERTPIGPDETTGVLHERLSLLGASVLLRAVASLRDGTAVRRSQDGSLATYAPSLKREHCRLDWSRSSREIVNQIRGLDPWPSAECGFGGLDLKCFGARPSDDPGEPGLIQSLLPEGMRVGTGNGSVLIAEIQPPGKRRMKPRDFSLGHPDFKPGAVLS